MKSVLIYGGAFNPPHIGHMALLRCAVEAVRPELTLVMPSKESPHKEGGKTPFWHRYNMCRCFTEIPSVKVSQMERFMPGKSYTVNTVVKLKQRYPEAQLYLLIGTDMIASFTTWREYKTLLDNCVLVAGAREGDDMKEIHAAASLLEKEGARIIILENNPVEISSTLIREQLSQSGESRFVTREVGEYIVKNKLYGVLG